jgi:TatD DNase family protein
MSITWVDSHCHLNLIDLSTYQNDMHSLIQTIHDHQIKHMLCVGVDIKTMPAVLNLSETFESVFASVGIHPSEVTCETFDSALFQQWMRHKKVVAIGETGLDYHYPNSDKAQQQHFFKSHIEWAKKLNKPLVVHSRDAFDDTLRILKDTQASSVQGVFHCFTGDWDVAKKAIDMGFYIGISGIVTFKNATHLHEVVRKLPLEKLLLETDAPWLAPHPYRGKQNTPAYIPFIGEKVAVLKGLPVEKIAEQTTENFLQLFLRSNRC